MHYKDTNPAINYRNIAISLVLVILCVYAGYYTTNNHRGEMTTGVVNAQITLANMFAPQEEEKMQEVTAEDIEEIYLSQSSIIYTLELSTTIFKIMVIVLVAAIIFGLLGTTGLIPRFGGMS